MTDLSHVHDPVRAIQTALARPRSVIAFGIDIAKDVHVIRCVRGTGELLPDRQTLSSRPDDLDHAAQWIRMTARRAKASHVFIGMEPTGLYWEPVFTHLRQALPGFGLVVVSPAAIAHSRYRRSSNLSKDDDRDALLIARAVIHGECFRPLPRTPLTAHMRETLWLYNRTQRHTVRARQHLYAMLQRVFPEALHGCGSDAAQGVLTMLRDSAVPAVIAAQSMDAWVAARVKPGRSRASVRALYQRACTSTHQHARTLPTWQVTWSCAWQQWHLAATQTSTLEHLLDTLVDQHPAGQWLRTIPRVGVITAAAFLAGAGDVTQYARANQLEKVFGLDLQCCQSGATTLTPRLSKRGYGLGLHYLYWCAAGLTQTPPFDRWYQRRTAARGCGSNAEVFALAAKLVRIMFHIARDQVPFDPARAVAATVHE